MKKVSIIIPCFNNASQVETAVDSLKAQTYTEFEALIIDDGSSDNSYSVAKFAAGDDKRFKVTRCEHGGVSNARNIGMDMATGEYIMFLDADDLYTHDGVEKLVSAAEKYGADIVSGGFVKTVGGKAHSYYVPAVGGVFADDGKYTVLETACIGIDSAVCSFVDKLYSAAMLRENGVRFPSVISGEDSVFTLEAMIVCKCLVILKDNSFYLYEQHEKSFTKKKLPLEERIALSDRFFEKAEGVLIKHKQNRLIAFLNVRRALSVYDFVMNTVSRDDLDRREKLQNIKTVSESKQYTDRIDADALSHHSARVSFLTKSVISGHIKTSYVISRFICLVKKTLKR